MLKSSVFDNLGEIHIYKNRIWGTRDKAYVRPNDKIDAYTYQAIKKTFEKIEEYCKIMRRTADGILDLYLNVVDGLVVYEKVINRRLMSELPFMATENIMMDAVKAGGDRQELHERIRELSMEAGKRVKQEGLENNLLELIAADPMFGVTLDELKAKLDPSKYVGRSKEQVEEYLAEIINPILDANKEELGMTAEINV